MRTKSSKRIFALLLAVAMVFAMSACTTKPAEFKIVKTNLVETGSIKILDTYIVITSEKPEEKAIIAALEEASKQITSEQDLSQITFWIYDREAYAGDYPSIGTGIYAPDGDEEQVGMYKPGEAKNMKVSADIKEKDWSLALSDREYEIYAAYRAEYLKGKGTEEFGSVGYMNAVYTTVEEKVSASKEEIIAAINRYSEWVESDLR